MKDQIETRVQQTQRYWYVDGLGELGTGMVMLIYGLSFFLIARFPDGPAAVAVGIGQPLIFIGGWLAAGKAVRLLKERLTYPRTGFVSYPKKRTRSRMARSLLLGAVVSILVFYVTLAMDYTRALLPAFTGGAAGLALGLLAYRLGLTRFYVMAAGTALLGALTAWLPLDSLTENGFFFGIFGLFWMISGAITLARYLRETNPTGEAL